MSELAKSDDYRHWIVSIKSRVQASQIKAAVSVNRELMELYWFLGEQIIEKQVAAQWGDGFLKQMGKDLQAEFPEIRGFSIRNLQRMRRWVEFWSEDAQQGNKAIGKQGDSGSGTNAPQLVPQSDSNAPQLVAQIPWGHNGLILEKLGDRADALFYVKKTIEHNWSRAVLTHHIESGLHLREGKAINNLCQHVTVSAKRQFRHRNRPNQTP